MRAKPSLFFEKRGGERVLCKRCECDLGRLLRIRKKIEAMPINSRSKKRTAPEDRGEKTP